MNMSMDKKYKQILLNTENKFLPILFDHCRSVFSGLHLPSHDHLHHMRVWYYAKDLLQELSNTGKQFDSDQAGLLILAVFFHDTGLTKTLNEDHGLESLKICKNFLEKNKGLFPFDVNNALRAIEFHDKKESQILLSGQSVTDTLKILSLCDDIDAYGSIGILRYTEIYLLRGISYSDLPARVLKNITSRFNLLSAQDWVPELFSSKHKARYRYSLEFFQKMQNNPVSSDVYIKSHYILKSYMDNVYHKKAGMLKFARSLNKSSDFKTRVFGSNLLTDMQQSINNYE